ncbi:SpoIIE family protein phosphatase [Nesterenkonia sp. LB17]|uniref:PP2C family protein-serine/threonine phosphatase n=1 Tax=unclassified Nesterenkonia TaxID=2629769 RepID=UPI001F4CC7B1|nr:MULTISPECIES: GAF domain-containing SpoIIE family protein phosphatase [unclassified Nesterenkonia]MCH8563063.1 SpoIIE family protein phosphatase [Nesterenkonia sp. YGD6]MCH8565121.1 SpoIIE family protein phosphatase [Nesterenkonia sp. LB17]
MDEESRQSALDALKVLDTPPDERVDRITRLAQQIFGVPMVSVNLLDRDRQWRKSEIGLGVREVPRADAFCEATIAQTGTLVIEDAAQDAFYASNPFVLGDPHLRFYAGHPLQAPCGEHVGTLCMLDTEPRTLDASQRDLLKDLAVWVQTELAQQQELDHAAVVQRALTPRDLPQPDGYTVTAGSAPAGSVSGDFHDVRLRDDQLRITLADVMGKGTGAGIIASAVRASMRTAPERSLLTTVAEIDSILEHDIGDLHMFVTLFCADVDTRTGVVSYVDGGHSLSFILRADGTWEHLNSTGLPLAMGMGDAHGLGTVQLNPGDALMSCSDGLLDLLDLEDPFGQVDEILAEYGIDGAVKEALRRALAVKAADDVTVLVVRRDS